MLLLSVSESKPEHREHGHPATPEALPSVRHYSDINGTMTSSECPARSTTLRSTLIAVASGEEDGLHTPAQDPPSFAD